MSVHLLIVLAFALGLGVALIWGVLDLVRARKSLRAEESCVADLTSARRDAASEKEFAGRLKERAPAERLAGRYAREVFGVVIAGSDIDQASIRERATRDLEDRPSLARSVSNLAVYIGLLGTLLGLAFAVRALHGVPPIEKPEDLKLFGEVTREMFGSFGLAFASAGTGITATVILAAMLSSYDRRASSVASQVETLCVEIIMPTAVACGPKPQTRQLTEEATLRAFEEYRRVSLDTLSRTQILVDSMLQASERLASTMEKSDEALGELASASVALRQGTVAGQEATLALSRNVEDAMVAATASGGALERFTQYVSTWDGTPLQEANKLMAKVVPNIETVLSRSSREQTDELKAAVGRVEELISSIKYLIGDQAALVAAMEDLTRQTMPLIAAPADPAPSILSAAESSFTQAQILTVLREIHLALTAGAFQAPAVPPPSEVSAKAVLPSTQIPELARTLERVNQTLLRLDMRQEVRANHIAPISPLPVPAKVKPSWRLFGKRKKVSGGDNR